MAKGWASFTFRMTHPETGEKRVDTHMLPKDDLFEHDVGPNFVCDCNPSHSMDSGVNIVVHNAFDGRDIIEAVERNCMDEL